MVSPERLEAMNGFHRAATQPSLGAKIGDDKVEVLKAAFQRGATAREAATEAGCSVATAYKYQHRFTHPDLKCACGRPNSHQGRCWARRGGVPMQLGEPTAFDFGEAIIADRDRLMRMAMSWTQNDKAAAEDLVSQAAIKILENQEKFVIGTNFPAWSTTIIKNLFFDSKRRAKPLVDITQTGPDGEEFETVDAALTTAPMQESGIVVREMVRDLQESTTPEQREVLLRAGMDGQTYEQIARETGVSEGTVKSRASRGRDQLTGREARVIPAVSRENKDSLDFVIQKLREERDRITSAISALEQCRTIFNR